MATAKQVSRDVTAVLVTAALAILVEHYIGVEAAWVIVLAGCALLVWLHELHKPMGAWLLAIWNGHPKSTIAVTIVGMGAVAIFVYIHRMNVPTLEMPIWRMLPPKPPAITSNSTKIEPSKLRPPYAIQIESAVISNIPRFWVAYRTSDGPKVSPADVILFIRLTNLQRQPSMISTYSVKIGQTKMIKVSMPATEMFYTDLGELRQALWVDDRDVIDKQLVGLNLQPRIPIQGWTLLEYPTGLRPKSRSLSELKNKTIQMTFTDVEGISFTSTLPPLKQDLTNEHAQERALHFARGMRDLSQFRIMDFPVSQIYTPIL